MGKIMSNMNMNSSTMKSSSSSSFSNSSSSSTSKIMSTNMGGMSLPPMRGMEMPNLRFKEGSDFKLGMNMQQFSAEDISIKLSGKELTVEADNSEEQFYQKHQIPENIDMEQMESSFSSDGVLVIK